MRTHSSLFWWVGYGLTALAVTAGAWMVGQGLARPTAPGNQRPAEASTPAPPALAETQSIRARIEKLRQLPGSLERRLALLQLGEEARDQELPELLSNGTLSTDEALPLIRRWAEKDPAACWAWYLRDGRRSLGDFSPTNLIFSAWAQKDPEAAMTTLRASSWEVRSSAADGILEAWALGEGEVADSLFPHLSGLLNSSNAPIYWAGGKDSERLGARLLALPPGTARTAMLSKFGTGLFEKDWQSALVWSQRVPEAERAGIHERWAATALQTKSRVIYFRGDGSVSPAPERLAWAQKWLTEEADAATRTRLGPKYVEALSASDPAAALTWAHESLGGLPLSQAIKNIVEAQAGKDRDSAMALLDSLPPGGLRLQAADALVTTWATQEPRPALNWALEQGNKVISAAAWSGLGATLAFGDPATFKSIAEERANSLPPELMRGAISNLIRKDPPGTVQWAASLPSPAREDTIRSALGEWARSAPPEAARFVIDHPNLPVPPAAAERLAHWYFAKDDVAAVDWAAKLPPGPAREAAMTTLRSSNQQRPESPDRDRLQQRLK